MLLRIAGFSFSTFNLGRRLLAILLSVGSELIRSFQSYSSSLLDVSFHHGALGSFLVGRGGWIVALGCSFLLRHVLLDLFLSFSSSVGDLRLDHIGDRAGSTRLTRSSISLLL